MYCDLHTHLYGSLSAEQLYSLGKNNPNPRWRIYTSLYEKVYHKDFDVTDFFDKYKDIEEFKKIYYFQTPAPFIEFQSKFNLIIAFSKFDPEEIEYITNQMLIYHYKQNISYIEYRMMYHYNESKQGYYDKTLAACLGLQKAEQELNQKITGKIALSLSREFNYEMHYEWLKEFMDTNPLIKYYLVGIDFCYIEEGFPPKDKKNFINKILQDNQNNPENSLSILYHVGESYTDKTPLSAVRWIIESAEMGCHRLGHCIALGISPDYFANKKFTELVSERIDQLNYCIDNYDKIIQFGKFSDLNQLRIELNHLNSENLEDIMEFNFDKCMNQDLRTFQEYCMDKILKLGTVIEVCPTSNLLIGMIPDIKEHPLKRFVEHGINITISTDDPGIFNTTMENEYELAHQNGLSLDMLNEIKNKSFQFKSEILSGRGSTL